MNIVILKNSIRYLRFQCIWPNNEREFDNKKVFYTRFILLTLTTTIILWGSLAHMVMALHENTGAEIDSDISFTISIIGAYYFNFSFMVNVRNIAGAFRDLSDFKTFAKPPGFDTVNNRLNTYSKWHQIYICSAVITLCIPRLLERKRCMENNTEKGLNEVCGLVTNVWFPFDVDYFPVKQIIFFAEIYSAYFSYATSSTVSFTIVESMEHVIFRISHLKALFLEALTEKDISIRRPMLRQCIEHHNFVIRVAETLRDSYSACICVHVLLTGAILACCGYQLLQEVQISTIALFLGWFLSLLMVAFVGQKLTDTGIEFREVIYNTEWYDLKVETQKDMIMVIMRCRKPMNIKAGPFGVISYQVVLSILKTSYSILSVLTGTS